MADLPPGSGIAIGFWVGLACWAILFGGVWWLGWWFLLFVAIVLLLLFAWPIAMRPRRRGNG